jgi:hypothetical protein
VRLDCLDHWHRLELVVVTECRVSDGDLGELNRRVVHGEQLLSDVWDVSPCVRLAHQVEGPSGKGREDGDEVAKEADKVGPDLCFVGD